MPTPAPAAATSPVQNSQQWIASGGGDGAQWLYFNYMQLDATYIRETVQLTDLVHGNQTPSGRYENAISYNGTVTCDERVLYVDASDGVSGTINSSGALSIASIDGVSGGFGNSGKVITTRQASIVRPARLDAAGNPIEVTNLCQESISGYVQNYPGTYSDISGTLDVSTYSSGDVAMMLFDGAQQCEAFIPSLWDV